MYYTASTAAPVRIHIIKNHEIGRCVSYYTNVCKHDWKTQLHKFVALSLEQKNVGHTAVAMPAPRRLRSVYKIRGLEMLAAKFGNAGSERHALGSFAPFPLKEPQNIYTIFSAYFFQAGDTMCILCVHSVHHTWCSLLCKCSLT